MGAVLGATKAQGGAAYTVTGLARQRGAKVL
jgi:hypothetical protein